MNDQWICVLCGKRDWILVDSPKGGGCLCQECSGIALYLLAAEFFGIEVKEG